ncbi:putative pentatricopeptide repeat-containing protein At3g25970 [Pyrus x bretschneideri]|uniref:putative pentatricopeptide repeat-containing protein At3g25970 n=1 Tax=Pyrus x bretschneideri TaxID=225117 RepID=UPI0020306E71|nr:putative pentatricopeptide repeat-containing protein At3g25970 [Pyrus x bretschneideri]
MIHQQQGHRRQQNRRGQIHGRTPEPKTSFAFNNQYYQNLLAQRAVSIGFRLANQCQSHVLSLSSIGEWRENLTGFSQIGLNEDALKLFGDMKNSEVEIDHYALSAVLRSSSDLVTLQLGQQAHALAQKSGLESNEFHGQGYVALDLFFQMNKEKVKLDHITFVAVLTACSHMGLVEQGSKFLKSKEFDYGITLRMEHYACAVDLYGQAGRLDEAKGLIEDLEPEEHCTYVLLLCNMYGHLKRWVEKASVKRLMREKGVRRVPGWSWIETKDEVISFKAEDRSHPHCKEIYFVLAVLMEEIRRMDVVANLMVLMHDFDYVSDCCDDAPLQNHDSVLLAA